LLWDTARGFWLTIWRWIYIAQKSDIGFPAFEKISEIAFAFTTGTNTGNLQFIAWRNKPTAQYMAGNNVKTRCSQRRIADK
jgi:hypothetical protein